jgi:tetratricopeptide (TPR) repeat protein
LEVELTSNIPMAWEWLVWSEKFDVIIDKMLLCLFHYWLIRGGIDFISIVKHARQAIAPSGERKTMLQSAILETVETQFELSWAVHEDQPKERIKSLWNTVKALGLEDEMGLWYTALVTVYGIFVNYEEAKQRFGLVLQKMDSLTNSWELGYTCLLAGQFCAAESMDESKAYLLRALKLFVDIGVVHEHGLALHNLAEHAGRLPDNALAISYALEAVEYLQQAGDVWGVNQAWMALAEHYIDSGNIQQAFHAYAVTRQFTEKVGNRRILGIDLSWESLAASRYGSLERALELRKRSQEIAIEVGNQNDIAWHTWELGEVFRLMGDTQQAKLYYNDAYPIFEKMGDYLGYGFYHRGMGDIAIMKGNWEEATLEFTRALESHEKEQSSISAWASIYYHSKLGITLAKQREFGEARKHLATALALAENWHKSDVKSIPIFAMACLLEATGNLDEAYSLAYCVANTSTTWNEVKNLAQSMIDAIRGAKQRDKAQLSPRQGECPEINQLIRNCLASPHLATDQA